MIITVKTTAISTKRNNITISNWWSCLRNWNFFVSLFLQWFVLQTIILKFFSVFAKHWWGNFFRYLRIIHSWLSFGVGAIKFCWKLPCNKNVKGILYLMKERTRFHQSTAFLYSSSRHDGSRIRSSLFWSHITVRSSFSSTQGERRSQNNGVPGPRDPRKDDDVLWTQKCGTNFWGQTAHFVV